MKLFQIFTKKVKNVEIFHTLTDTDSTSLEFIFNYNPNSDIADNKSRDVFLGVILGSKMYKRFEQEKNNLHRMEKKALKNHRRLYLYPQILTSTPKIFYIIQKNDFTKQKKVF